MDRPHPPAAAAGPPATEARNPRTRDIDTLDTLAVLRLLNAEDATVAAAVGRVLPELAALVDATVERLRRGGRLHYVGAGSSGRVAVADAAEISPTFGVPPDLVLAHHAGGAAALRTPQEGAEDDRDAGAAEMAGVGPDDVVVGISAGGRTPFVLAALAAARGRGALTAVVTNDPGAPPGGVDHHLALDTGPEAIAGSTRLKAATAQKLLLNSLSTAAMVALGHTWSNLMIDVRATNAKLRARSAVILGESTGASAEDCAAALAAAGGVAKVALVSLLVGCSTEVAVTLLDRAGGRAAQAVRLAGVAGPGSGSAAGTDPGGAAAGAR